MKAKFLSIFGILGLGLILMAQVPRTEGVRVVSSLPTAFNGNYVIVVVADNTDPAMYVWDATDGSYTRVFTEPASGIPAPMIVEDGSGAIPAIVGVSDQDTGLYFTSGAVRIASGGAQAHVLSGNSHLAPSGSEAVPSRGWGAEATTGTYRVAAGVMGFSSTGVKMGEWGDRGLEVSTGAVRSTAVRDEFRLPCRKQEEDNTAEAVTDAAMNIAYCRQSVSPSLLYHYRLDGAQATPFVILDDQLDIDNDAGASEGVQVVFDYDPQAATGWTFGDAVYMRIGIEVADVSDLSVFHFGWRLNEDYVDNYVLATQDTYASFSIPGGTASATAATDGTDQTELESSCDIGDGETWIFEVRISATGVPTYYCVQDTEESLALLTTPTAIGPFASGDVMVPYIAYLGTAGTTEVKVDFVELGIN
jgi:hypothetical protein